MTGLMQCQRESIVLALAAEGHLVRCRTVQSWYVVPGLSGGPAARCYSAKVGHDLGHCAVDNIYAAFGMAGEVLEEFVMEAVGYAFQVT
ncbi:hypothetical protein EBN03_08545 [Nocardia stercoris]|uniref:Uncharacterized protein n=1 Tax=Nocardia stercoris TaxID=2483361 RepID=A0A3M2L695_9NOCA|nr:hypothetical protein EBN03_08545 [Nocardia stercoris]